MLDSATAFAPSAPPVERPAGFIAFINLTKWRCSVICPPEESEAMHQTLLDIECEIYDALEIPYRVLEVASGDLGAPAYRKFDIEAWMPGRNNSESGSEGTFGEITQCEQLH